MSRIGVSCSKLSTELCFFVDVPLASEAVAIFFTRAPMYLPQDLLAWERLFEPGKKIVKSIVGFSAVRNVAVWPKYFKVVLWHADYWHHTFPKVIELIRKVTGDPGAAIEDEPSITQPEKKWHMPLLQKFNPLS